MSRYKPYPKYKESGVAWLGEVPEGWEVLPLKYITTYNDEVLSDNTAKDYEFNYVDIGSVDASLGITKYEKLVYKNAPSRARRKVRNGDIIVSTVRTYLRAITSIENTENNLIVSTGFAVIRPKKEFNSKFASYLLKSSYFVETVVAKSVGISYPAINSSELVTIKSILPPLKEQTKIANYLEQKTKTIDTLIEKSTKAIELLKERRVALVSAVVTGKVDVRDYENKKGEENEI
jgi:type I restriction enzyme S subunit